MVKGYQKKFLRRKDKNKAKNLKDLYEKKVIIIFV